MSAFTLRSHHPRHASSSSLTSAPLPALPGWLPSLLLCVAPVPLGNTKALLRKEKIYIFFEPYIHIYMSHAFNISSFFFCQKKVNSLRQLGCSLTTTSLPQTALAASPSRQMANAGLRSPLHNPFFLLLPPPAAARRWGGHGVSGRGRGQGTEGLGRLPRNCKIQDRSKMLQRSPASSSTGPPRHLNGPAPVEELVWER